MSQLNRAFQKVSLLNSDDRDYRGRTGRAGRTAQKKAKKLARKAFRRLQKALLNENL